MKNNRGIAPLIVVLIIAGILALAGGGYYAVKKYKAPAPQPTVSENQTSTQTTQNETADLKTYTGSTHIKFSVSDMYEASDLQQIAIGLETYYDIHRQYPKTLYDLLNKDSNIELPKDGLVVLKSKLNQDKFFEKIKYSPTSDLQHFVVSFGLESAKNSSGLGTGLYSNLNKEIYGINCADPYVYCIADKNPETFIAPTKDEIARVDISNWKTYANPTYNYSFEYPGDLVRSDPEHYYTGDNIIVFYFPPSYNIPSSTVSFDLIDAGRISFFVSGETLDCPYIGQSSPENSTIPQRLTKATIGSLVFDKVASSQCGTKSCDIINLYSIVKNNLCYQMALTVHEINPSGGVNAASTINSKVESKLDIIFQKILSTFKFSK